MGTTVYRWTSSMWIHTLTCVCTYVLCTHIDMSVLIFYIKGELTLWLLNAESVAIEPSGPGEPAGPQQFTGKPPIGSGLFCWDVCILRDRLLVDYLPFSAIDNPFHGIQPHPQINHTMIYMCGCMSCNTICHRHRQRAIIRISQKER